MATRLNRFIIWVFTLRGGTLRKLSEERTRKEMIDLQLEQAGWYLRDHAEEQAKVVDNAT